MINRNCVITACIS